MAAKTGNTYFSGTITDGIEISTAIILAGVENAEFDVGISTLYVILSAI